MAEVAAIVCNNSGRASGVARQSATIVPDNRLALAPSLAVGHDCSRQSFGTRAIPGGRPRLFQTIVWHSRHPWRSATIVADNRLALAPSLAVDYSRVFSFPAPCYRGAATASSLTP
ncbi:MAG: hypothetical protein ACI8W7_003965 [Gammaproteobacteria bacterium]|jgi:hypothetical protein